MGRRRLGCRRDRSRNLHLLQHRARPRRLGDEQLQSVNLHLELAPRRRLEGFQQRFDILRFDVAHLPSIPLICAATIVARAAASKGGRTGSATINSRPAFSAAWTPWSDAMTPP